MVIIVQITEVAQMYDISNFRNILRTYREILIIALFFVFLFFSFFFFFFFWGVGGGGGSYPDQVSGLADCLLDGISIPNETKNIPGIHKDENVLFKGTNREFHLA